MRTWPLWVVSALTLTPSSIGGTSITQVLSGAQANALFGAAMDGDAGVVAIGQRFGTGVTANCGVVRVFERDVTGSWVESAALSAASSKPGDRFGEAVSVRGDVILVGAPGADPAGLSNGGAAYVFRRVGGVWTEEATLLPQDGSAQLGASFGSAVATDNDAAVVGTPYYNDAAVVDSGCVYAFQRSGAAWNQEARITLPTAETNAQLGAAVDMAGALALLGAPRASTTAGGQSGTVLVKRRTSAGLWIDKQAPLAPVGVGSQQGAEFGGEISIAAAYLVIGAPAARSSQGLPIGAAFAYDYVAASEGAEKLFVRDDVIFQPDAKSGTRFGAAVGAGVSGSGTRAVVGAPEASSETFGGDAIPMAGKAFVYSRNPDGSFVLKDRLAALKGGQLDAHFGAAVLFLGVNALVGAPDHDVTATGEGQVSVVNTGSAAPINTFELGNDYRGGLTTEDEVDVLSFFSMGAYAGETVKVSLEVRSVDETFVPLLRLEDASGDEVPLGAGSAGGGSTYYALNEVPIPADGVYRLEVASAQGAGEYVVTSQVIKSWKKTRNKSSQYVGMAKDDVVQFKVSAVPGNVLDVNFKEHENSFVTPRIVSMTGPDGQNVNFASYLKKVNKGVLNKKYMTLQDLPVETLGEFVIEVENVEDIVANLEITGKVKEASAMSTTWREGEDVPVEVATRALASNAKNADAAVHGLQRAISRVYDLVGQVGPASTIIERSFVSALPGKPKKRDKMLRDLQRAAEQVGPVHSLLGVPEVSPLGDLVDQCGGETVEDNETGNCWVPAKRDTVVYVIADDRAPIVSALNLQQRLYRILKTLDPDRAAQIDVRAFFASAPVVGANKKEIKAAQVARAAHGLAQPYAGLCALAVVDAGPGWDEMAAAWGAPCQTLAGALGIEDFGFPLGEATLDWMSLLTAPLVPGSGNPVSQALSTQSGDLASLIEHDVVSGRRVVVVAHSRANRYAELAVSGHSKELLKSVAVVAVGSPVDYSLGDAATNLGRFSPIALEHDPVVHEDLAANLINTVSELCEEPCSLPPPECDTFESSLEPFAVHQLGTSYLVGPAGNQIAAAVFDARDALPLPALYAKPVGQGVLQITLNWSVSGGMWLRVTEPDGDLVDDSASKGSVGHLDMVGTPADEFRENYFVGLMEHMQPGTYVVEFQRRSVPSTAKASLFIRAGTRVAEISDIPLTGLSETDVVKAAVIKYKGDGRFSIKTKL